MTDRSSARAAKDGLRAELAPLDGVGGIGIGRRDGSYVVTVDVVAETDGERVPSTWDGVDVEVRVIGRVRPQQVPSGDGPDGAGLDGARLDGAGLDGARLDGAGLDGAGLDGARLDGARTRAPAAGRRAAAGPLTSGRAAGTGSRLRPAGQDGLGTGR